jgi:hypothetical protein
MSKYDLKVAREYGVRLPEFSNRREAKRYYLNWRDEHLALLQKIAERSDSFAADYSVKSLKGLEAWYFELHESNAFDKLGISRATFETCMGIYLGEVAVRQGGAEWFVEEFAFMGGRY